MTSISEKDDVQSAEQLEEREPKTENSDEEEEEEEEEEKEKSLIVEGKREKKKVERLTMQVSSLQKEPFTITPGKGQKLCEIERIQYFLSKKKTDELRNLHKLLYNRPGTVASLKKNVGQFSGYPFEKGSDQYKKKEEMLKKYRNAMLKNSSTTKKNQNSSKKESESENSSDDEPLIKKLKKKPPTDEELKETVKKLLADANLEEVTMKQICKKVYENYPTYDLTDRKEFIKETVKEVNAGSGKCGV
uniref:Uncharacterized protein n=1 Tax=Sphaerodactylus townsendi TaxID=933632 RepID=A0ACB8FCZ6_9SAUR